MFYASLAEICEALEEPIPDDLNTSFSVVLTLDNTDHSLRPTTFLLARVQNYYTIERELARDLLTSLYIIGALVEDIKKALAPKLYIDLTIKLLPYYYAFLPMFDP